MGWTRLLRDIKTYHNKVRVYRKQAKICYQKLLQKAEIRKHADHDKNWNILPNPVKHDTRKILK